MLSSDTRRFRTRQSEVNFWISNLQPAARVPPGLLYVFVCVFMCTACEKTVKTTVFTLAIKSVFSTSLRRSLSSNNRECSVGTVTKIRGGRPPAEAKELKIFSTVVLGQTHSPLTCSMVCEGYCLDRKAVEAWSWPLFSLHVEVRIRRFMSLPLCLHDSVLN